MTLSRRKAILTVPLMPGRNRLSLKKGSGFFRRGWKVEYF
jgi:hypothetical protein